VLTTDVVSASVADDTQAVQGVVAVAGDSPESHRSAEPVQAELHPERAEGGFGRVIVAERGLPRPERRRSDGLAQRAQAHPGRLSPTAYRVDHVVVLDRWYRTSGWAWRPGRSRSRGSSRPLAGCRTRHRDTAGQAASQYGRC